MHNGVLPTWWHCTPSLESSSSVRSPLHGIRSGCRKRGKVQCLGKEGFPIDFASREHWTEDNSQVWVKLLDWCPMVKVLNYDWMAKNSTHISSSFWLSAVAFLLVTIASKPDTVSILHRGLNVHGCTAACSLLLLLSLAGPRKWTNCSCATPCLFQCEVLNRSQFHTLPHNNSSWPNQFFTVSPINVPCNIHALYPNKSPPETMLSINCSKPCPGYLCEQWQVR